METETRSAYEQLFLSGEAPTLNDREYRAWTSSRDKMHKTPLQEWRIGLNGVSYAIIQYREEYGDASIVDAFCAKEVHGRWFVGSLKENQKLTPIHNLVRQLTASGTGLILSEVFFSESVVNVPHSRAAQTLLHRCVTGNKVNGQSLVKVISEYSKSANLEEQEVAHAVFRPLGIYHDPTRAITVTSPQIRKDNSRLIEFLKTKGYSAAQTDSIILAVANKNYMLAAQKMRDYHDAANAPVHPYVVKLNEIYGQVIGITTIPLEDVPAK